MTVSAQTPYSSQSANSVTTSFPFAYKIRSNTDIVVVLVDANGIETAQTLGVHYTVSGVSSPTGGSVDFTSAPATGLTVKTRRVTSLARSTDYQNNGDLPAAILNGDVDAVWLALQELTSGTQAPVNALITPVGEVVNRLPAAAARKDRALVFDATTGQPVMSTFTATQVASAIAAIYGAAAGPLDALSFLQGGAGAGSRPAQEKARERVSAEDFLAVGNGVADDTTMLRNAVARLVALGGGMLLLKPGANYRITGRVGTDPTNAADLANNITVWGYGSTITLDASLTSTEAVCLEGDGNAVVGVNFANTRTLDHNSNLTPQRTPYHYGIVIGGKNHLQSPRSLGSVSDFKTRATVYDCTVTNFNAPIHAFRCGDVYVKRNKVDQFTDTGILVDDCTSNIRVRGNRVTRGGDDHIFCRHYSNSPWAAAGNYIGGLWIEGNFLQYTFGKNIGTGGYSNVSIRDNDCLDNWAGGVDIEVDSWAQRDTNDNSGITVFGNRIYRPGRYWATSGKLKSAPIGNNQDCGIHSFYADSVAVGLQPRHVKVLGNIIVNPYRSGISMHNIVDLEVRGNTIVSGSYDHGAGAVVSQGVPFVMDGITDLVLKDNPVDTELTLTAGQNAFAGGTFSISNPAGRVVIRDNPILAGVTSWSNSAGTATSWDVKQDFTTYTTDASSHNVMAFTMLSGTVMSLKYRLTANQSDASNRAWAERTASYYCAAGAVTLQGTTSPIDTHSNASWANGNTTSGANALTTVTGVAGANITWKTSVEIQMVQ